jgi:putative transposase
MEERQYNRRSIRVQNFDYSQAGAYFVTICAWKRSCIFGKAVEGEMVLLKTGEIVAEEWLHTAVIRPYVTLDVFPVMPNHFHGILWLLGDEKGTAMPCPLAFISWGGQISL